MKGSFPNYKRQKAARKELEKAFSNATNTWAIHYACESLYNKPDGKSPRITAIAARNLRSEQTKLFSIHRQADVDGIAMSDASSMYDELEQAMLHKYSEWLKINPEAQFIHWNMRNATYGFEAIEHRFSVLSHGKSIPTVISNTRKVNLASLLNDIYGPHYIDDKKMETLAIKNGFKDNRFLNGSEEALAFSNGDLVAVDTSCQRKVDIFCYIAQLAHEGNLKTNTTWWQMNKGRICSFATMWKITIGLASLVGTILAAWQIF